MFKISQIITVTGQPFQKCLISKILRLNYLVYSVTNYYLTMLLNLLIFSVSVSIQWVSCHPNPHIVIVGSGAAGIAAATRLLKNNFTNITILEAESRIGGRIHSVKFGEAYVDLGANFCHGEKNNIVYSLTKELGVLKNFPTEYRFLRSNGEILDKATASKVIKFEESVAFLEEHEKCKNLSSVGECLKIKSGDFIKSAENPNEIEIFSEAYDWVESSVCSLNAAFDLNDLNITSAFQDSEGDQNLKWKGQGYKTILDIMMEKFPNAENPLPIDDKIFLDKEVTNITNWQEDTAIVLTNDGGKYEADHVIFTPSLGVLKTNHKDLFEPDLPEDKVKAINNIGFGAIVTIIMHFPVKWWDGAADFPVMWTTEHKEKLKEENLEWLSTMTGTVQAENNTDVILSWYVGKYVPHIETLSEEEVRKGLNHLLNSFFSPRFNVTMPDKIIRTLWHSNPHFKGTYSYESVKGFLKAGDKLPETLSKPLLKNNKNLSILFAGEATSSDHFSTVHGAIESGYREADRLINFYNTKL